MAVQFAGSSSTGDRRRRRLVVSGDGTGVEASLIEGDGAEMESQLVASEAAGPWVPATEMRIWIYAAVIAVIMGISVFALSRPAVFHAEVAPLTNHLLVGQRPVLAVGLQSTFLALAAQLGMLISWYRTRCRLDFGGRYRVWPWAAGLLAIAAFCLATDTHRAFGEVISRRNWLPAWRTVTVAWLLPFTVAAALIGRGIDRDMRNSRSSLYTFRLAMLLGVIGIGFELFQPELQSQTWFQFAFLLTPMFAGATLFISFWLHARIVAYVCPDPPEIEEGSSLVSLLGILRWLGGRIMFWRRDSAVAEDEDAKPKRRRKKAEPEETAPKRKRKAPTKRTTTTRTRTRSKPVDEEEAEESNDDNNVEETESTIESNSGSNESWENEQEQWQEEPHEPPRATVQPAKSKGNGRVTFVDEPHGSSVSAPHSRRQSTAWEDESKTDDSNSQTSESNDESEEDRQFQLDSGMTADQMKGLSKRQKRDLKKQLRDQQRTRGR